MTKGNLEKHQSVFHKEGWIPDNLEDMATAINKEHHACEHAATSAVEHAIKAGELMVYAKAQVNHGEWEPWLKQNFEGGIRTAQMYMKVFRERDKLSKTKRVSDLSLRGALRELSEPKLSEIKIKPSPEAWALESAAARTKIEIKKAPAEPRRDQDEDTVPAVSFAGVYIESEPLGPDSIGKGENREEDLLAGWSDEERKLYERVMNDKPVIVNMRTNGPHRNLFPWLKDTGRLFKADRSTDWGNPFEMPDDGDRDTVCDLHDHHYAPYKASLHKRLDELRGGKAWGCWCAPKRCHLDYWMRMVDQEEA